MLSDCYNTKTYQMLDAKIEQMWEPDYRPNKGGFMSQQVVLSDVSGQHTVTVSTKFKDGFIKPDEQGQTHTWKIKCYDGKLSGFTTKPAIQGGYSTPSQAPQGGHNPPSQVPPEYSKQPPPQADKPDWDKIGKGKCFFGLIQAMVQSGISPMTVKSNRDELEACDFLAGCCMNGLPPKLAGQATRENVSAAAEEARAAHEARQLTGDDPHTTEDMGPPPF